MGYIRGEVITMRKILFLLILLLCINSFTVTAEKLPYATDTYFDVDLNGYELYSFGSFYQIGDEVTPLAQLFFRLVQKEQQWIDEPRLYIKGNQGYFHIWKEDGTNVLYAIKKVNDHWEIIDEKRKKINRIPVSRQLLKEALIERLVEPTSRVVERLWYRGEEKVLKIEKDETNFIFYVTIQVVTFEGPHNPPYKEETITFKLKGDQVDVVNHKERNIPEGEFKRLQLR